MILILINLFKTDESIEQLNKFFLDFLDKRTNLRHRDRLEDFFSRASRRNVEQTRQSR